MQRHAGAVTRQDGGLGLRLAFAAHRAIGHDAAIVEDAQRRIERMERLSAGFQRARPVQPQGEGRAAVLPDNAGLRQDDARAELEICALDRADGPAVAVDNAEPDRVA